MFCVATREAGLPVHHGFKAKNRAKEKTRTFSSLQRRSCEYRRRGWPLIYRALAFSFVPRTSEEKSDWLQSNFKGLFVLQKVPTRWISFTFDYATWKNWLAFFLFLLNFRFPYVLVTAFGERSLSYVQGFSWQILNWTPRGDQYQYWRGSRFSFLPQKILFLTNIRFRSPTQCDRVDGWKYWRSFLKHPEWAQKRACRPFSFTWGFPKEPLQSSVHKPMHAWVNKINLKHFSPRFT